MTLLTRTLTVLTRISLVGLVLFTALTALLRYGFDLGWVWMQNLSSILHGMIFLLGAALTLQADEHVRVDAWYNKKSPTQKKRVNRLGFILFLLPFAGVIFITALPFAAQSWQVLESSSESGGLGGVFLYKSAVPLLGLLLALYGLRSLR